MKSVGLPPTIFKQNSKQWIIKKNRLKQKHRLDE